MKQYVQYKLFSPVTVLVFKFLDASLVIIRVQRGSVGCSVVQLGCSVVQLGCSVAQQGAAWLSKGAA
jgi:hypothetical protein